MLQNIRIFEYIRDALWSLAIWRNESNVILDLAKKVKNVESYANVRLECSLSSGLSYIVVCACVCMCVCVCACDRSLWSLFSELSGSGILAYITETCTTA